MRPRIYFISVLVLVMGSCNPLQLPANLTGIPAGISNTPAPSEAITCTPLPTPLDIPVESSPALVHIAFQEPCNGWGVSYNDVGAILRTVDGGKTWLNATPPGLTAIGYSAGLSVLDINTAWVLSPSTDFFNGTLYHTSDGGLTWTSVAVPFGGAGLQFPDASTGRALANRGMALGSNSVELYQTSDGGATWLSVFNNGPTRPDAPGSLPFSGIKNGMTFLDANIGWVTGSRPVGGEVYLFVTHDGGVSWEQQSVPLPAGYEAYQIMPLAPVFSGSVGFLPLMIYMPDNTSLTFFVTHDGGITWTGDPTNATSIVTPGNYAFADDLHGWSWDGGEYLYSTIDGAQTWSKKTTNLDLTDRLAQLEFIPGSTGQFTGWALTSTDNTGHSKLFRTTDNGITWTPLIP